MRFIDFIDLDAVVADYFIHQVRMTMYTITFAKTLTAKADLLRH